jgi:hypothetical protein
VVRNYDLASGHHRILGSAFGAFGIQRLGDTNRNLGENLPYGFEAYVGVGVGQLLTDTGINHKGEVILDGRLKRASSYFLHFSRLERSIRCTCYLCPRCD